MRTKLVICLFCIVAIFFVAPVSVSSLEVTDSIYLLTGKTSSEDMEQWLDDYNKEQTCNSLLGDPTDENSVAWLLQQIFDVIKIVGPILVVILSSIDFAQVIIKGDDEAMSKSIKKLGMRLLLAGLLFFIPLLVEVMLDLFGVTAVCGLK